MRRPDVADEGATATDSAGLVARAVVAVIVLVTVASGPLLGGVTFTQKQVTAADVAPGNATVAAVQFPETVTLVHRGDGRYGYSAPPTRVKFARITGGDVQVTYGVVVPALDLSESRTTLTDGSAGNTLVLRLGDAVAGATPERGEYRGRVYVSVLSRGERVFVDWSNVSVEVTDE